MAADKHGVLSIMLRMDLEVKFRVFGVTLGTLHRQRQVVVPLKAMPQTPIQIDERGVKLSVTVEPVLQES